LTPNREVLVAVASRLTPLLPELVFVGGQVAELLVTDPAAVRVRPTVDVDVVVAAVTRFDYGMLEEAVRRLGFSNDTRDEAPICRWLSPDGHVLDLMPVDPTVLGFTNRWYATAVADPMDFDLAADLRIRIPTAPAFLATKLEAYRNRGNGDLLGSPDLEDVITVIAGRPAVVAEIREVAAELQTWLQEAVRELMDEPDFDYALQGALPDATNVPGYAEDVRARFEAMA
jgi:predicted nucleotidyltransferase